MCGSYKDAVNVREFVSKKLHTLGLTLNWEKTRITNIKKSKCRFLGVDFFIRKTTNEYKKPVRAVKKGNTTVRQRFSPRIIFHAPIYELLEKLCKYKFLKRNKLGDFIPISKSNCVSMTHPQILNYYNSKIYGILNYFNFCHNRMNLWSIIRFLKYSCALSLAKKFKLKTLAKTFRKFGPGLAFWNDKRKEFKIFRPKNLRMLSMDQRFNLKDDIDIDKILRKT